MITNCPVNHKNNGEVFPDIFAELIVQEYEKLPPEICPWADAVWRERDAAELMSLALKAQLDELLEALKLARLMLIAHGETHAKIDEAIARAEGKQ